MSVTPVGPGNSPQKPQETTRRDKSAAEEKVAAEPQDVVEISNAARERLAGIPPLSSKNENEVRNVAEETRKLLEQNDLTLGAA